MDKLVLGLGFGDEGKGRVVDYLCYRNPNSTVVRFSGGGQAGHTVYYGTDGLKNHVFSNLGSGTLRGCPTYWSKYCTFDPSAFLLELYALNHLDHKLDPVVYVDGKCPVVTPMDIAYQRNDPINLGHGTVGSGIGTTQKREEDNYHLLVEDLAFTEVLILKLRAIQEYYEDYQEIGDFVADCAEAISLVTVTELPISSPKIYEGSQGLLLDRDIGFFPNVTRSHTSSKNAVALADGHELETYAVTRAYLTRHGNGPMFYNTPPGIDEVTLDALPRDTNKEHEYQGKFRLAPLSINLLEYAIAKDPYLKHQRNRDVLVITCLDQVQKFMALDGGVIEQYTSAEVMMMCLQRRLKFRKVLGSFGEWGTLYSPTEYEAKARAANFSREAEATKAAAKE